MKAFYVGILTGCVLGTLGYAAPAQADSGIASLPIASGAGGVTCSVINIGAQAIPVIATLHTSSGSGNTAANATFAPGSVLQVDRPYVVGESVYCVVGRSGGSVSKRQLKGTLQSLDANGNALVTVPVDIPTVIN